LGLSDWFPNSPLRQKALRASPEVLETWASRPGTNVGFPLIAVPNRGIEMRLAFEAMADAGYGYLYAHQPAVRAVVDYLASNVAQLALRCYERTSDIERHEASDHPAAETMRHPNNQTPGQKFIFDFVRDRLVYGNAFAAKFRPGPGTPLSLTQLPPARTSVLGPSYFAVDAYRVYRVDGTFQDFEPLDILHWPGATNPDDPRLGLSPLETLRKALTEEAVSQAANLELLKAGLLKPGYIGRPLDAPQWSEEAATRFQEKWANSLKDAGRHTPILEEGMTFEDFGVSPKDAEMLAGREFTRDEVARQYGMVHCPPESEEERDQFLSDVLPPICEMFSAHLDLSILQTEFMATDFYFEFDLDEKLTGDERLKALTSASGAPILTRNESRAMLNKPPKPDGDELITPLNVIVGGKPSPAVMPVQNPLGPEQDGSAREQSMNGHGKALFVPHQIAQRKRRDRYAAEFTEALRKFFKDQETSMRQKALKDFDLERWVKTLTAILKRLMRSSVEREAEIAAARFGIAGFAMNQVENYIAATAEGKANEINLATRDALLEGDLGDVFAEAKEVRAQGTGETLATKMSNFAQVEAAKQTPDAPHRYKTWIVDDEDVSAHPEMNGKRALLTEPFVNGKHYPPYEHPGCRCMVSVT
jgi:HK97 family phage portal protein